MDEREALALIADALPTAGDDAAVVDGLVLTTDMLHERTDFPAGTSRYTAGWRAVGASLSDIAAMGGTPVAAMAVYAADAFEEDELLDFLQGARDVCDIVGAEYVGGDLDRHEEFTVVSTAVGETESPVRRSGASPGDVVAVTGPLGRTAAGLAAFEHGEIERGNDLFRFEPRVGAGLELAPVATAMMDSSDGLARSLHQLVAASGCGVAIESDCVPIHDALDPADGPVLERAVTVGEDFELVVTLPERSLGELEGLTAIGHVTESGVMMDDEPLEDSGYTH